MGRTMEAIDFKTTLDSLREVGFNPMPNQVHITVPDAKDVLWRGLNYFTGGKTSPAEKPSGYPNTIR